VSSGRHDDESRASLGRHSGFFDLARRLKTAIVPVTIRYQSTSLLADDITCLTFLDARAHDGHHLRVQSRIGDGRRVERFW